MGYEENRNNEEKLDLESFTSRLNELKEENKIEDEKDYEKFVKYCILENKYGKEKVRKLREDGTKDKKTDELTVFEKKILKCLEGKEIFPNDLQMLLKCI